MAFSKEVLDEILKGYHGPEDFYGPEGIMKQLTKALVERTMEAELTVPLGYENMIRAKSRAPTGATAKPPKS